MNTLHFKIAVAFSVAIVIAMVAFYSLNIGPPISKGAAAWSEFGEFFGGMLNPIFAMLAFLALLWSIALQRSEFDRASFHLSEQIRLAREEAESTRKDRLSQELLEVIKDIDVRLNEILAIDVSAPGTTPRITVRHMASEAERLAHSAEVSPSYSRFLELAHEKGSLVEASTRELLHLVERMRDFISDYSSARQGDYAPIIIYYADKVFHLLHLVNDLGGAKDDTYQFFATVADPHG